MGSCETPSCSSDLILSHVEAGDNSVSGEIGHVNAVKRGNRDELEVHIIGQKGMFHFIQIASTVLKLREFVNTVGKRTRV